MNYLIEPFSTSDSRDEPQFEQVASVVRPVFDERVSAAEYVSPYGAWATLSRSHRIARSCSRMDPPKHFSLPPSCGR